MRATGAAFIPLSPSSMTCTITGVLSTYARRFVFPFEAFAPDVLLSLPAANEPTTSAIARSRLDAPVGLLFDALKEAAQFAHQAPDEQRVPSHDTMREGVALLRSLPPEVDTPEPVIEPTGALSWLWDRGAAGFLVLAVDGKGRLQRSAVIGGQETWGESPLTESLAPEVLALLGNFRAQHG